MTDIVNELRTTAGNLINGTIEDGEVSTAMLSDAADKIERLRNLMQAMLDQLPIGATITLGDKVLDHTVLSLIRNEMRAALTPAERS